MKKLMTILAIAVLLISATAGVGIVQAKSDQPNLAPGVWYTTTVDSERVSWNWDWTPRDPGSYPNLSDYELMYQRVGDVLFVVRHSQQLIFRLNEDNVWTCGTTTWDKVYNNTTNGNHYHQISYDQTITFDKNGLTYTYSFDLYGRKTMPGTSTDYFYRGSSHNFTTVTGPLGKPTNS
jgi:hypothetical protein